MSHLSPAQWVALPALAGQFPKTEFVDCATGKPKPATSQFPDKKRASRATWSPKGGEGERTGFRRLPPPSAAWRRLGFAGKAPEDWRSPRRWREADRPSNRRKRRAGVPPGIA